RGVVYRPGDVDGVRLTEVAECHRDVCAPRRVPLQMCAQCFQVLRRVAAGRDPRALAFARGINVFDDAAMEVVSIPITVIAGLAHKRCGTEPEPISLTPSNNPDSARTRSAG